MTEYKRKDFENAWACLWEPGEIQTRVATPCGTTKPWPASTDTIRYLSMEKEKQEWLSARERGISSHKLCAHVRSEKAAENALGQHGTNAESPYERR